MVSAPILHMAAQNPEDIAPGGRNSQHLVKPTNQPK